MVCPPYNNAKIYALESKLSGRNFYLIAVACSLHTLFEVAIQQALQCLAMTGFVLSHFVNGVMDGI